MKQFIKRIIPSVIAAIVSFTAAFAAANIVNIAMPSAVIGTDLYEIAIVDVIKAEENEIMPLVVIPKDIDRILLITFHRYPESYPANEEITLDWGEVWTFTADEIDEWYDLNNGGVTDWELRFKQLIGLPADKEYTHFTAMWVSPDDIIRPAYNTDISSDSMTIELPEDIDDEYVEWFENNIINSYFYSQYFYPWTRLGYTYDWADNNNDYGLSEFLVLPDSHVVIEFTLSTEEFITWLINN